MSRFLGVLVGVFGIFIVGSANLPAQSQLIGSVGPDFSGKWVLVSSQPSGGLGNSFGDKFSIAQDATTLRVDSTAFRGSMTAGGPVSMTRVPLQTIYSLDGIEHPSQVITDPPLTTVPPASGFVMTANTEESISKATWAGRQLVIMTYSRIKITAPSLAPSVNVIRRTVRHALSMEADGTLMVESLIVADPLPWGQETPSPTPIRTIYKKG